MNPIWSYTTRFHRILCQILVDLTAHKILTRVQASLLKTTTARISTVRTVEMHCLVIVPCSP